MKLKFSLSQVNITPLTHIPVKLISHL